MLKKSLITLAGAGSLLLSSLALAQNSIPPSAKAEYRAVIASTSNTASTELKLSLRAVTLPPARIASPFEGFDFNTALIIAGDPELNISLAKWTLVSGTLPAGLTLSASGQLTGTPTETATAEITLEVTYKGKTATGSYTVQANDGAVRIKQYPDARYYEDGTWPKDCQGYIEPADGYLYEGATGDGIYRIQPGAEAFDVNCNMTYEGGGWTVFQVNTGAGDFNRTWAEYEAGFGALTGDHWIGLQRIHDLMKEPRAFELYAINLGFGQRLAEAATISDAASQYTLAGDWMFGSSPFSTFDRDNDSNANENCAQVSGAGYWFPLIESSCDPSATLHLNSNYYPSNGITAALMTKKLPPPPPPLPELEISSIPAVEGVVGDYLEFDFKPYVSISEGELDWSEVSLSLRYIPSGMTFENGVLKGIPTADMDCCSNRLTVNYGELSTYYNFSSPIRKALSISFTEGSYGEYDFKKDIKWEGPIDFSQTTWELTNIASSPYTLYKNRTFPEELSLAEDGVLYGAPSLVVSARSSYTFDLTVSYQGKSTVKHYTIGVETLDKTPHVVMGEDYYLDLTTLTGFNSYGVEAKDIDWNLVEFSDGKGELPPGISFHDNIISGKMTMFAGSNRSGNGPEAGAFSPGRTWQGQQLTFTANINGKEEKRSLYMYAWESFGIPRVNGGDYYFDLNPYITHFFFENPEDYVPGLKHIWRCKHPVGVECSSDGIISGSNVTYDYRETGFLQVHLLYELEVEGQIVQPIAPGVTSRQEVVAKLGNPDEIIIDGVKGQGAYRYNISGSIYPLYVFFDEKDVVDIYFYGKESSKSLLMNY